MAEENGNQDEVAAEAPKKVTNLLSSSEHYHVILLVPFYSYIYGYFCQVSRHIPFNIFMSGSPHETSISVEIQVTDRTPSDTKVLKTFPFLRFQKKQIRRLKVCT